MQGWIRLGIGTEQAIHKMISSKSVRMNMMGLI